MVSVLARASARAFPSPANFAAIRLEVSARPDGIARPDACIRARPGRVPRPDVVFVELVAETLTKW